MSAKNHSGIVLESSLQSFFFDELKRINESSTAPLATEMVFYGSTVMDHYGDSSKYFEIIEGRVRDKILGIKFLEAASADRRIQKKVFREVGDTSLILCGYFAESVKDRIVDLSYYQNLGKSAYDRLNSLEPDAFNMSDFYRKLAHAFDGLSNIMSIVAQKLNEKEQNIPFTFYISSGRTLKVS